jgi:hypothetical protein
MQLYHHSLQRVDEVHRAMFPELQDEEMDRQDIAITLCEHLQCEHQVEQSCQKYVSCYDNIYGLL